MICVNISVCVTVYFFSVLIPANFPAMTKSVSERPSTTWTPTSTSMPTLTTPTRQKRRCRSVWKRPTWSGQMGPLASTPAFHHQVLKSAEWSFCVYMMLRRIDLNHFVINGLKARNPLVVYSLWPKTVEFALWMAPLLSWTKLVSTLTPKLRFFSDDGSHTCSVESSTCDFSGIKRIRLDSSDKVRFWNLIIWNVTSVMSNLAIPWKTNISWMLIPLAILLIYTERADY